ncbi:MAG: hypothetical protein Q9167_006070 [Letrouitia subvulpina]
MDFKVLRANIAVEAKVFLSKRNFEGWQCFNIPGLFTSAGPNTFTYLKFDIQAPRSKLALDQENPREKFPTSMGSKINLDEVHFDPCSLNVVEASNPSHISGYLQSPIGDLLQLKLKGRLHYISSWDCDVKLYSIISSNDDERIQVEHFASLLCVSPPEDLFEDIVSFALIVSHGPSSGESYDLKTSEGLISHNQYPYGREASEYDKHMAKIVVHRKSEDFGKALNICFKCSYSTLEDVNITLPTFYPLSGNVLSEKIWLAKPAPPKTVQWCERSFLSSWRFTERLVGRVRLMCFDRIRFSRGLKDDCVIKISHLRPVRFVGLKSLDDSGHSVHPYEVVRSVEITTYNVCGGALECRMSLELQVGEVQPLVKIDTREWTPKYSVVGSRLASELIGEWRETGKGQVGLFKQSWMTVGQRIRVEVCWRQSAQFNGPNYDRNATATLEYELPKIADKQVLGGRLACNIGNALIAITQCNRKGGIYAFFHQPEKDIKLPTLGPGYSMHLSFYQQNRCRSSNFRRLHQRPCENDHQSLETINEENSPEKSDNEPDILTTAKFSTTTSSAKPISPILNKNSNIPASPNRNRNCLYLLARIWFLIILMYGLLYCCGIPTTSIGLLPQAYTTLLSISASTHYWTRGVKEYVSARVPVIEETHQGERVVLEQSLQFPSVIPNTGFESSIRDHTSAAGDYSGDDASQTTFRHGKMWRDRIEENGIAIIDD